MPQRAMNHAEKETNEPDRRTVDQQQKSLKNQSSNRQQPAVDQRPDHSPLEVQPTQEPLRRRAARRLLRAEMIYAAALAAFAILALCAHFYAYFYWDLATARYLQNLPLPGLLNFMRVVSVFGNRWIPFALTAATACAFYFFKRRSEAAGTIFSAGLSGLINYLLKVLIARPRPTTDLVRVTNMLRTHSFPSGHVTFYVCYFGFLFFVAYALLPRGTLTRRLLLILAALPVLLIGLSRIYLGEHWPSDTIGAYLWSGLWLALSLHLYRRWKERATFHHEVKS